MPTASEAFSVQLALRRARRTLRTAACALTLYGASLGVPVPALAETDAVVDAAIGFLHAQGYRVTEVERTWLGRVRIEAVRGNHERELVLDPRTGEVMRDFIEEDDDNRGSNSASNASNGDDGDDDDYGDDDSYDGDDDRSDDSSDDDHDNSGSGSDSDNSGSGSDSDNSGSGSDSDNSGSGGGNSGSGGGGDDGGDDD